MSLRSGIGSTPVDSCLKFRWRVVVNAFSLEEHFSVHVTPEMGDRVSGMTSARPQL